MTLKYLLAGAALAAGLAATGAANAANHVIGNEGSGNFVGNLLEGPFPGTAYLVASDGETPFDPFGAGFDTSDGVNFSGVSFVWNQAADSNWTEIGSQTWVLPASTAACGAENEPVCEPVGHFVSPSAWNPAAIGNWIILESPGGPISDVIKTFNTAAGAELLFYSDPPAGGTFGIPEPASWVLMIGGFGFAGAALRRRRAAVAA